jgi:TatD DNase family protein
MTASVRWLDAHTHLDSDDLFSRKSEVLDHALAAGVQRMLLVNSEATESSFSRTAECLSVAHAVRRYVCFGIHPHNANRYSDAMEKRLRDLLRESEAVGLGEIGLDFFYNFSPKEVQIDVFRQQLRLARSEKLPVIIHCRDAYPQLAEILRTFSDEWEGMIHCYTGTIEEMAPLLDLGFFISFSGIVTFKNATVLQLSAKAVPLDRILVETDAPFLAPVPFRGKVNEPAYVIHTAKFLAALRGISEDELAAAVNQNFDSLFATSETAGGHSA